MARPMTNYPGITDKDLIDDSNLILLKEALTYSKLHKTEKMRYSKLRNLCDESIRELTRGGRTGLGGSFEACVKRLSNTELDPSNRPFDRVRSEFTKKHSELYMRIDVIRNLLEKKKVSKFPSNKNIVTKRIIFDSPVRERDVNVSDQIQTIAFRSDSKEFVKDALSDLSRMLRSHLYDIHLSANENSNLELSKDVKNTLLRLIEKIIIDKYLRRQPLMFTIQYKGEPDSLDGLKESDKFSKFYERLTAYFVVWAKRFHNYVPNENDLQGLRTGKFTMLTRDTKLKFRIFLEQVLLKEDKTNTLKPIVEEIVQKL